MPHQVILSQDDVFTAVGLWLHATRGIDSANAVIHFEWRHGEEKQLRAVADIYSSSKEAEAAVKDDR